jgi:hypothetical protein
VIRRRSQVTRSTLVIGTGTGLLYGGPAVAVMAVWRGDVRFGQAIAAGMLTNGTAGLFASVLGTGAPGNQ